MYIYDGIRSKNIYSDISGLFDDYGVINTTGSETDAVTSQLTEAQNEDMRIIYEEMASLGEDYIGYIDIINTQIQYPIVQGDDNTFYLTHDFTGKINSRGNIFMDYRNNPDFSDDNTVLYGHNMRDKSMFNQLMNFKDEQFAKESGTIIIVKETELLVYRVFASYKIDAEIDYMTLNFDDEQAFELYLNEIRSRTDIDIEYEISYGDLLLTLSTCSTSNNKYRYVVHAVLK